MLEKVKDRFSGVILLIVVFALGLAFFVGIPIIFGSISLYVWEYCLCMSANWSWFSRWLYGMVGLGISIIGIKWIGKKD